MKWIDRVKRKMVIQNSGVPLFYLVYKPQKDGKNVIATMVHPEIHDDVLLNQLLDAVAERIRHFYNKNPELLQDILKHIKEETE